MASSASEEIRPRKRLRTKTTVHMEAINTIALSERRLKQYSTSKAGNLPITVGLTGARTGDLLRGVDADTSNVLLRVDSGVVRAPAIIRRSVEAEVGREALLVAVAKHFGVSRAVAELRYNDFPVTDGPNHQPIGAGCSHCIDDDCDCEPAAFFTILSQGAWQGFADKHGNGDELKAMVEERRSVCWRDVLKLMFTPGQPEGKKLVLRPRLFEIAAGPERLMPGDSRIPLFEHEIVDAMMTCVSLATRRADEDAVAHYYDFDGFVVRLPAPASDPFGVEDATGAILEASEGLVPSAELNCKIIQRCVDALKPLSLGGLKSCLQKVIRFRAAAVMLPAPYDGPAITAPIVAAVAASLLFANKGGFSPELQLFTRGNTAAFKRMAVILIEDAWIEASTTPHVVAGLISLALATQRMTDYEPPRNVVLATLRLAAEAAQSRSVIAWRRDTKEDACVNLSPHASTLLRKSSKLLRILRSFGGDMDMFDTVAEAGNCGELKLSRAVTQVPIMPLCHLVDQHTFRGVAHVLGSGAASTFALRFDAIFQRCTGFNPRIADTDAFEKDDGVARTRFAQRCCLRFALKMRPSRIAPDGDNKIDVRVNLDTGVLAAAVGPLHAKVRCTSGAGRMLLVLLGVQCPEDEVVMLKPARATRDLFGNLCEQERAEAISYARSQTYKVKSPLLQGTHTVSFVNGMWHLDDRKWAEVVKEGLNLCVPAISAPKWWSTDISTTQLQKILTDDESLEDALSVVGDGMMLNAQQAVIALTSAAKYEVALRGISMLRQQYATVAMPTPSLHGCLASDQLAAYDGDWDVYRLLALVSRLVPGALRPIMPPNFTVPNAILLRAVEQWMMEGARLDQTPRHDLHACVQARPTQSRRNMKEAISNSDLKTDPVAHVQQMTQRANRTGKVSRQWQDAFEEMMHTAEEQLMEHQRAAIACMHRRDAHATCGGHFLVMDTGHGKTITSLVYAYRWICQNLAFRIRRILWITPAGTVDNLIDQLQKKWAVPVHSVPRVPSSRQLKAREGSHVELMDFHVNVIHADHLRTAIVKGLAELAPSSFLIFDEVDEMYAPTLRTSAARRMCQLCPKFIAQTATPMRKNESQLVAWLADTCSFPVENANFLVAASSMVSMQLELGIIAKEEEVLIPMVDEVRDGCRHLLSSRAAAPWVDIARLVQMHTDEAMVQLAIKLAKADRAVYSDGGVLLVADTLKHADRLIKSCNGHTRTGDFASLEAPDARSYAIVVVSKDKDRGYNSAARLGAMVTGAYAGNAASRHQLRGRLRRLGQRRAEVRFVTVCMENSLLHLLHQRHSAVDTMNITLEQLGQRFSAEVLRGIERHKTGKAQEKKHGTLNVN